MGPIWLGADSTWGRFDLGPIWLGPIWLWVDLVWGRFDLLPTNQPSIFDKCCNVRWYRACILWMVLKMNKGKILFWKFSKLKFIPIQNKLKFENIQYFFNMIRVNPHIAVVSILTFPMILQLTCKIRMRGITRCAKTGAKTVLTNDKTPVQIRFHSRRQQKGMST